jgi:hypothetical protein
MHERGNKSVQGFGGKLKGKRQCGRLRHRWTDGIRMDLGGLAVGCVEWIQLSQYRDQLQAVINAVMNL